MEEDLHTSFHLASIRQIQTCVPECTSPAPLPKEVTIVFRFDEELLNLISETQDEFRKQSPTLYYYPRAQLHLTILGNIPVESNIEAIKEILETYMDEPYLLRLWGLGMGKFSSSFSAYPQNFSLHDLRNTLRTALGIKGTDFTIHLPEYEFVGWINFSRNVDSVPDENYRKKILSMSERKFGQFSPIAIDIIENASWVLAPEKCKLIQRIKL